MATRATLRTIARIRADQTDSTFPTDTEYNYFLDQAAKEVWYDLVQAGWPVNFSTIDLAASGSNPVALGASGAVAFIRGVFWLSGGTYAELDRVQEGDRASLMSSSGARPAAYDVRIDPTSGPVVELLPAATGTCRVHYVPEHPGFANDAAEWYGPARSDELIVLRSAAKAMRKEGNDQGARQLDNEYSELLFKVQTMASWFNMRHSVKIRDVGDPLDIGRSSDGFDYEV